MLWKQAVRVVLRDASTTKKHVVDVILQIGGLYSTANLADICI